VLLSSIWGDGPERDRLEILGRELGLGERLQWMGATDTPEQALAQVTLCVTYFDQSS